MPGYCNDAICASCEARCFTHCTLSANFHLHITSCPANATSIEVSGVYTLVMGSANVAPYVAEGTSYKRGRGRRGSQRQHDYKKRHLLDVYYLVTACSWRKSSSNSSSSSSSNNRISMQVGIAGAASSSNSSRCRSRNSNSSRRTGAKKLDVTLTILG